MTEHDLAEMMKHEDRMVFAEIVIDRALRFAAMAILFLSVLVARGCIL